MKFLITDDHPIFRQGLKAILNTTFAGSLVIEAGNAVDAMFEMEKAHFDVCFLDIDMPGENGLELCLRINKKFPSVAVVMMTINKEPEVISKAFLHGAMGYILKENSINEISNCVKTVLDGNRYLGENLAERSGTLMEQDKKKKEIMALMSSLTQAELKTLKLVNRNLSSRQIAELLFVTEKTVENYRSRICKKLNIEPGNNSLLRWVLEHSELLHSIKEL